MTTPIIDGKKRAMTKLIEYFEVQGKDYSEIESTLLEWNKMHPEPLRENIIKSTIAYLKRKNAAKNGIQFVDA